jgi:transposase InsO family protein
MDTDSTDDAQLSNRKVKGEHIDTSTWATPDVGAFDDDERAGYLARKEGVLLYLRGDSNETIKQKSGVTAKQIYRLISERCLETHADGQVFGWRGLVYFARVQPYRRSKSLNVRTDGYGAVGAMALLLEREPQLAKAFRKRILRGDDGAGLSELNTPRSHASWFVKQLRAKGYETRNEWPFNTTSNGYFAVYRLVKQILAESPRAAARAAGGYDLERKLLSGDGVDRPVRKAFERVEMDAHKIDGRFCVMMPQLDGDLVPKIVHRLWVIVILDVVSRAVLGYHLSLRREVSKDDVLAAIKKALSKWSRRPIYYADKGVAYAPGAALPSGVKDEWVGLCWDETSVDGALAETCTTVRTKLKDVVGSILLEPKNSFAVRRSKDDRPFIERFFLTLTGGGFQRLSNTTGKSPKDKKGRDPDQIALTSQFQYEYAEELLDVLIANYNAERHSSLGNRSPLEYIQFMLSRNDSVVRRADQELVEQLVSYRKKCQVKGGAEQGRHPFVNFGNGRYSNDILANRHDLVGKYVWVTNHLEYDARVARCSTVDGHSLGILRVAPPWSKFPHSLAVRSSICAAARRGAFSFVEGADAIETFMNFVERQPNKKLPIHPAYLEARRILTVAAEHDTGGSMVSRAKQIENTERVVTKNKEKKSEPLPDQHPPEDTDKPRKLPARRMAAS